MRIGHVIGKITMNTQEEAFRGGRWLMVNPVDTDQLNSCVREQPDLTNQPSLVVYDNIGAGQGDIIGFVEGAEATAPFDGPTP
ncbi:MAG: ethanolamine utilization protein EutN, partial [Verrucomicrobiae bacterium]|nr:ethanolamine utilization protein EutN [Verrucomicrobiae bacterium]